MILKILGAILLGYLVGSIPWALIIGKLFCHVDIRQSGSGNLGATNALRVTGHKWIFVVVTILDGLKGFAVYMLLAKSDVTLALIAALAVVVGHCYPVFANFHGGKGVATVMGIVAAISIQPGLYWIFQFLIPFAVFVIIVAACRYVSLGSLVAMGTAVLAAWLFNSNKAIAIALTVLWLFVIFQHRANIKRLASHTENKISFSKAGK